MAGARLIVPRPATAGPRRPVVDTDAVGDNCAVWYWRAIPYARTPLAIMRRRARWWPPLTCTTSLPGAMAGATLPEIYNHCAIHVTVVSRLWSSALIEGGGDKSLTANTRRPRGWSNFFTRRLFDFFPRATG